MTNQYIYYNTFSTKLINKDYTVYILEHLGLTNDIMYSVANGTSYLQQIIDNHII